MSTDQSSHQDNLDKLHLGEVIQAYMVGKIEDEKITEEDQKELKYLFTQRIVSGEEFLRSTHKQFWQNYFGHQPMSTTGFDNEFSHLGFLYKKAPRSIEETLSQLKKEDSQIERYTKIFDPQPRNHQLSGRELKEQKVYTEASYFSKQNRISSSGTRKVALLGVRRKQMERAVDKTVELELKKRLASTKRKKYPLRVYPEERNTVVTDCFGIEVVTYTKEQAFEVATEIYKSLGQYSLRPNLIEEPAIDKEGHSYGTQAPGIDNHYLYGSGNDHLIQIKALRTDGMVGMVEIIVTDYVNMLTDKIDHINFRARQNNKRKKFSKKRRKEEKRLIDQGCELIDLLPKTRKKILQPTKRFEETNF